MMAQEPGNTRPGKRCCFAQSKKKQCRSVLRASLSWHEQSQGNSKVLSLQMKQRIIPAHWCSNTVPPEEKLKQAYIPNSANSNEVHKWHAFCLWRPPEPLSRQRGARDLLEIVAYLVVASTYFLMSIPIQSYQSDHPHLHIFFRRVETRNHQQILFPLIVDMVGS